MKNVLLIGDSIRIGYQEYVKEKLEGKAEVFFPGENSRFVQYTLRYISIWAESLDTEKIDTVHWNNGIWDILRLDGEESLTPKDWYIQLLERTYRKIRMYFPNAKIIFALTTSVKESWRPGKSMLYNNEIEEYNQAAAELMKSLGVEVNDLYSVSSEFDDSMRRDWVHFNEKGSSVLADAVVKALGI